MNIPSIGQRNSNVGLVIDFGGFNASGMTGALLAAPGSIPPAVLPAGTGLRFTPLTIAGNGLTGLYMTVGGEFPQGGYWMLQAEVLGLGTLYTSAPAQIWVIPNIATLGNTLFVMLTNFSLAATGTVT